MTFRSCIPARPQETQLALDKVDGDDEESSERTDLDDCLGFETVERLPSDDVFDFASPAVSLTADDLACEDNVLKVEDRELFIFQFFGCVERNGVAKRTNQVANASDGGLRHKAILPCDRTDVSRRLSSLNLIRARGSSSILIPFMRWSRHRR